MANEVIKYELNVVDNLTSTLNVVKTKAIQVSEEVGKAVDTVQKAISSPKTNLEQQKHAFETVQSSMAMLAKEQARLTAYQESYAIVLESLPKGTRKLTDGQKQAKESYKSLGKQIGDITTTISVLQNR